MSLLKQQRFLPYFLTQFLGAFNDNVFKNALAIIIIYQFGVSNSGVLVNLAAVVFIAPFFIFSPLAGQIADKFEKSRLVQQIKWCEIAIMLLAVLGLYWHSTTLLFFVLFLMGTQSAFFGPVKYSILPQQLKADELLGGNALVEAGTFLAILLGTILGGILGGLSSYAMAVSIAIVLLAVLGRIVCQWVPAAAPSNPELQLDVNPWRSSKAIFANLRQNNSNFLTVVGISWFWFFGATFLTQFPLFASDVLGGNHYVATLLMATFSIGIGLGSLLCAKLSNGRVEIGIVPLGALGMTLCGIAIGVMDFPSATGSLSVTALLSSWVHIKALIVLLLLACFGGLFIVPLYAFLQTNTPEEFRSRNIAANNMMNALFMLAAGLFAIVCFAVGNSVQTLFFIVSLMNAAVAVFIFLRAPEFILRAGAWILVNSLYRIGKHDLHHIPKTGPALLICNHVSFVDPIIIGAMVERPVRFVMHHKIYDLPVAYYLFKQAKAIPIASAKVDADLLCKAYDEIAETLESGELVCIFPEGGLTPDGDIQMFKPGTEKILQRTPVHVVPMALRGLWGTWFSRKGGRAMKGWPRNWLKRIDLMTGAAVAPADAQLDLLQHHVAQLRDDVA